MIKLDVVSGFLGAGKTTFILKLLSACQGAGEKVVLIENEFGQIGFDGELIKRGGFRVYEINQGCVCCSLKANFAATLHQIVNTIRPDRIIFEPSGIFILSEIFTILSDPELEKYLFLNSITTIVDCQDFTQYSQKYTCFFENQVQYADSIVLSKSQYVSEAELAEAVTVIQSLNEIAQVRTGNWDLYSQAELLAWIDMDIERRANCPLQTSNSSRNLGHDFDSVSIQNAGLMERCQLEQILNAIKLGSYGNIIRGKGFVRTQKAGLEFSYVNGRYLIHEISDRPKQIVGFIGEKIQKDDLIKVFAVA